MDKRKQGAWLLAHSKSLDHVSGPRALRLENIGYAGKIGRLYNVLRRGSDRERSTTIDSATVTNLCQLNDIDRASRKDGLRVLQESGRIDLSNDGSVAVLGATTGMVLETAAEVFENSNPSRDERAVLTLSEEVAAAPMSRQTAEQMIGDLHKIKSAETSDLVNLCKTTALIDEEVAGEYHILFNSNTFRDKERAKKAYLIIDGLKSNERSLLSELEELLRTKGALSESEVKCILGEKLYSGLASVGYFDRMEVNNRIESMGYVALPDAFQRYGRPFEEDPVDDAKALMASLTYGITRRDPGQGRIMLPNALLDALIAGREVGGASGVTAIGEDYQELERRGVVKLIRTPSRRFRMKLVKPDVGELARTIIRGGNPAEEAVLLGGRPPAISFKGPDEARQEIRRKNKIEDRKFVASALDRIRGGG